MSDSVALVLCGGGGKGAFQIGAWEALEEKGIFKNITAVSGTSVGALNAVLFALGDRKMAEHIWKKITPKDLLSPNEKGTEGLFTRDGMEKILRKVPLEKLAYCRTDVYAALYNKTLNRVEEKHLNVLNRSEIEKILLAASAMPIAYSSVEINGYEYCDAGVIELNNTPVSLVCEKGYGDVYIISLNQGFYIHNVHNGRTRIDLEKCYPKCNFYVISPLDHHGGILRGTINFTREKISELMFCGYTDTKQTLEGRTLYHMVNRFGDVNRKLEKLFKENFHTAEEIHKFVNHSGMKSHHSTMGGDIHWSEIVTVDNIQIQQHTAMQNGWNHYRMIDFNSPKKYCILYTFNVFKLVLALEDHIENRN